MVTTELLMSGALTKQVEHETIPWLRTFYSFVLLHRLLSSPSFEKQKEKEKKIAAKEVLTHYLHRPNSSSTF